MQLYQRNLCKLTSTKPMINFNMLSYFLLTAFSSVPRNGWPVCNFTFWCLLTFILLLLFTPLCTLSRHAIFFLVTLLRAFVTSRCSSYHLSLSNHAFAPFYVQSRWFGNNTTRRHVAGGFIAFRPFKQGSVTQMVQCLGSCHVLLISIWQLSFSRHINLGLCQTTW